MYQEPLEINSKKVNNQTEKGPIIGNNSSEKRKHQWLSNIYILSAQDHLFSPLQESSSSSGV